MLVIHVSKVLTECLYPEEMVMDTLYCTRISFTSKEITMQVVTEILDSTALSLKRVSSVASFISK